MNRYRITFADTGVVIEPAADIQSAISSAILARLLIAYTTGNKPCLEIVEAKKEQ